MNIGKNSQFNNNTESSNTFKISYININIPGFLTGIKGCLNTYKTANVTQYTELGTGVT